MRDAGGQRLQGAGRHVDDDESVPLLPGEAEDELASIRGPAWKAIVSRTIGEDADILAVGAIQRIRRYYATLLPDADHFFPQPTDQTAVNELLDIGTRSSWRGVVFTTSSAVLTVNCIVGGTGIALLCTQPAL